MRMKVLLVGGSPEQCSADLLCRIVDQVDKVVAVDRGLDMLLASGIAVDLFCGDADSVGEDGRRLVNGIGSSSDPLALLEVERYNPHKDFTDLDLALKAIETRWGLVHIIATCLEGGLPDHFLAVMGRLMNWKGSVELIHDGRRGRILKSRYSESIFFSALTGEGIDSLTSRIANEASASDTVLSATIPYKEAALISLIREQGQVVHEEFLGEGVRLIARVPSRIAPRIERYITE